VKTRTGFLVLLLLLLVAAIVAVVPVQADPIPTGLPPPPTLIVTVILGSIGGLCIGFMAFVALLWIGYICFDKPPPRAHFASYQGRTDADNKYHNAFTDGIEHVGGLLT